jgi:hypothetical protein
VNASTWLLYKLGQPISPLEIIRNGSHALHAVSDEGVSVDSADGRRRLSIRSLDAALVSPGRHNPFPQLAEQPDLLYGLSHCLCNNIWGEAGRCSWTDVSLLGKVLGWLCVLMVDDAVVLWTDAGRLGTRFDFRGISTSWAAADKPAPSAL